MSALKAHWEHVLNLVFVFDSSLIQLFFVEENWLDSDLYQIKIEEELLFHFLEFLKHKEKNLLKIVLFVVAIYTEGEFEGQIKKAQLISDPQVDSLRRLNTLD